MPAKKTRPTASPIPPWLQTLASDVTGKIMAEAKTAFIATAQSKLVEPLAERVARAMSAAEDSVAWSKLSEDDKQRWKTRALAALAELARRPR